MRPKCALKRLTSKNFPSVLKLNYLQQEFEDIYMWMKVFKNINHIESVQRINSLSSFIGPSIQKTDAGSISTYFFFLFIELHGDVCARDHLTDFQNFFRLLACIKGAKTHHQNVKASSGIQQVER